MSLSELERLVASAEHDPRLRRSLRQCRSRRQLVRTAWGLGFGITRADLVRAGSLEKPHQAGTEVPTACGTAETQVPALLPRLAVAGGLVVTLLAALTAPSLTPAGSAGLPIPPAPVGRHG